MSWASWILEPPSWFGLKGNTSVIQFTHELGILGQTCQPIGYFIPKDGIGRAGFSFHTCQSTYAQVHMLLVELDGDFFPTLGPWSDPELLSPLTTAEEMDEGVWWFAFSSGTDTKFAESAWTPTARASNATMIGSRRILGINEIQCALLQSEWRNVQGWRRNTQLKASKSPLAITGPINWMYLNVVLFFYAQELPISFLSSLYYHLL